MLVIHTTKENKASELQSRVYVQGGGGKCKHRKEYFILPLGTGRGGIHRGSDISVEILKCVCPLKRKGGEKRW